MNPIETLVLIGILLLITLINLKIAIRYIDHKQANQTKNDSDDEEGNVEEFMIDLQPVEWMENNFEKILSDLLNKKRKKFTIYMGDGIVGVLQTIETYKKDLSQSKKGKKDA